MTRKSKRKFDAKLFDNPPRPPRGHRLYFDHKTTGLAMRVPAHGTPTLQVIARGPDRRERRITIAHLVPHGAVTPDGRTLGLEGVRAAAVAVRDKLRRGEDLEPTQAVGRATSGILLGEAVELHIAGKMASGKLQARAADEYRHHLRRYFPDWASRPLKSITRQEVHERHRRLGATRGHYAANAAFRTFRAAYRRAARLDPTLPVCPVVAIDWYEEQRRDPGFREHDLPLILGRIRTLANPVRRDFYEFVLFTGMRRGAAESAKSAEIDFKRGVLLVPNPKGGVKKRFELPLSDHVLGLLERRVVLNAAGSLSGSPFLFPARSARGSIAEPRDEALGFSPHALRHVFTTVAGAAGLPLYQIKLLTNHSLPRFDVTLGYMWPSGEQLRAATNIIAKRMLAACPDKYDSAAEGSELLRSLALNAD